MLKRSDYWEKKSHPPFSRKCVMGEMITHGQGAALSLDVRCIFRRFDSICGRKDVFTSYIIVDEVAFQCIAVQGDGAGSSFLPVHQGPFVNASVGIQNTALNSLQPRKDTFGSEQPMVKLPRQDTLSTRCEVLPASFVVKVAQ